MSAGAEEESEGLRAVNVEEVVVAGVEPAIQNGEALLTQKTSRQHAVTPKFEGRLAKVGKRPD